MESVGVEQLLRIFCSRHSIAFEVPRTKIIRCEIGDHALSYDFPQKESWEYCRECKTYWLSTLHKDGPALAHCPRCLFPASRRYVCHVCRTISLESEAPSNSREYAINCESAYQWCSGCGTVSFRKVRATLGASGQTEELDVPGVATAREHLCDRASITIITALADCPFCHVAIAQRPLVEDLEKGNDFPSVPDSHDVGAAQLKRPLRENEQSAENEGDVNGHFPVEVTRDELKDGVLGHGARQRAVVFGAVAVALAALIVVLALPRIASRPVGPLKQNVQPHEPTPQLSVSNSPVLLPATQATAATQLSPTVRPATTPRVLLTTCFEPSVDVSPSLSSVQSGEAVTVQTAGVVGGQNVGNVVYLWKASAGMLVGTGVRVRVDTTGVPAGTTIQLAVTASSETGQCTASGIARVTISAPPTICFSPNLVITPAVKTVLPNESTTLHTPGTAAGLNYGDVSYQWTSSAGTISGNGTTSRFSSAGVPPGTSVEVRVTAASSTGNCLANGSARLTVIAPPSPETPASYSGPREGTIVKSVELEQTDLIDLGKELPGVPVMIASVEPRDQFGILESPGPQNKWKRLVLRPKKRVRVVITVHWRVL